jgi:hypothetical protein
MKSHFIYLIIINEGSERILQDARHTEKIISFKKRTYSLAFKGTVRRDLRGVKSVSIERSPFKLLMFRSGF